MKMKDFKTQVKIFLIKRERFLSLNGKSIPLKTFMPETVFKTFSGRTEISQGLLKIFSLCFEDDMRVSK